MRFATRAIHAGQEPDKSTGAVTVPIFQTSTYAQDDVGKTKGYEYSRTGNPTRTALETVIASLENGRHGLAFSSGMSAVDGVVRLLGKGNHVVVSEGVYGGVYRLFAKVFEKSGLEFSFVDTSDPDGIERAVKPNTKMLWIESPSNPLLKLTDIRSASKMARSRGILTVVDNTFMSPYFQRPLELGCDIVVHSTTKYLGGHSDVVGGAVVANDDEVSERLKFIQNSVGAIPGPFDCWLVLRGIKTLALRMERHNVNAQAVAQFLENHPKVERVLYPGLRSHPQHDLAQRQMTGFGGMVTFWPKGGVGASRTILKATRLFILAESLGGVESLISSPAAMTHASIPTESRMRTGIRDDLVRLSVGVEDVEDLIEDLSRSLDVS